MKVGVIFAAYNCADTLTQSLAPWLTARALKMDGHSFVIAAVSVPFTGFDNGPVDPATHHVLAKALEAGEIDHLILGDQPVEETEARGEALKRLVADGVEVSWLVDADEIYALDEISRVFTFIASRPLVTAFRGSLKNYVGIAGDSKTYIAKPFTPMRGHRTHIAGGYVAAGFWDDNNVVYCRPWVPEDCVRDTSLSCITIPKTIQFTPHYSWPASERSRRKIAYQNARPGWLCDFAWDDSRGGLIWRDGVVVPETARDPE